MSQLKEHTIPGHYLYLALSSGLVPQEALPLALQFVMPRLGVTLEDLLKPDTRIPLRLIDEFIKSTLPDSATAFAFEAGMNNRLTSQGIALSTLIMTSATIRDALQLGRFMPIISTALMLRYEEENGTGFLYIAPETSSSLLNEVIAIYMAAALDQLGKSLTGGLCAERIMISGAMPESLRNDSRLQHWEFGAPINCLVFAPEGLAARSLFADDIACRLALGECESALAVHHEQLDLPEKIKKLMDEDVRCRSRDGLLDALHLSRSTLNRKLAQHDTSFAEILKEWRQQRAKQLLATSHMSLTKIASDLGYNDQSSFSHAFTDWTGSSPSTYRQCRK